jgi:hypothetical protein
MKVVLIGYGEIGKGLLDVFSSFWGVKIHDPFLGLYQNGTFDLMLVAIPYSSKFVQIVKDYQLMFDIKETIIFSSVPIGTSRKVDAVHSPIEGPHDQMGRYIRQSKRWVGGDCGELVLEFFRKSGCNLMQMSDPEHTEFLKLRSTTIYGIAIEFARYSAMVGEGLGLRDDYIRIYDAEYNRINASLGRPFYQRYVLKKPEGKIGGHCVLPNAKLLQEQYPHPFIQTVLDFNKED